MLRALILVVYIESVSFVTELPAVFCGITVILAYMYYREKAIYDYMLCNIGGWCWWDLKPAKIEKNYIQNI